MWGWLKAISEGFLNALVTWWKAEEGEAAKSQAKAVEKQLESVKEGMKIQAEMAEKVLKAEAPTSGAAWNKLLLILACIPLLSGCGLFRFHVYNRPYVPVPPQVEKPTLGDESPFNEREQVLASYAIKMREAVNAARAYAIESNSEQGYPVSPEDEKWLAEYRSK
ncbi:MAG: hypothetical protein F6K48_02980 [Okeania sp. SIO3H1]|nr:hypothetical protein [Okeania sp. SIO3H1]